MDNQMENWSSISYKYISLKLRSLRFRNMRQVFHIGKFNRALREYAAKFFTLDYAH